MSPLPSLRAVQKDARRTRIATAARTIFAKRGFFAATTAEIAKSAGVGVGTLFRYASDKNELLLLVLNDELERITNESIAGIDASAPVLAQLIEFYRRRFDFWAADPELARAATAYVYMGLGEEKPERLRAQVRERAQLAAIAEILTQRRRRTPAQLARTEAAAQVIQFIYRGEMRNWLGRPDPQIAAALERLRIHFAIVLDGLEPPGRPANGNS